MKKHTLITIENDYYSDNAYQMWKEDINYLVNEIDIFCSIDNDRMINVVEREKRYTSTVYDYKNEIKITAKGYSQGDCITYTIQYNETDLKTPEQRMYFSDLIKQLEKTFTHQNDYNVMKYEVITIDGEEFKGESFDSTCFSVTHIEFPDKDDVLKEYISIYGEDYDKAKLMIE